MCGSIQIIPNKRGSIFHDIDYSALGLTLILFRTIIIAFLNTASLMIGFNTKVFTYVYYITVWVFFLLGISRKGMRPSPQGALFFAFVVLIGLLSIPFSPIQYLWNFNLESFIIFDTSSYFHAVLYIPLVFSIKDINKLRNYLSFFAHIFILLVLANDFISISLLNNKHDDDMAYSYGVVWVTCILLVDYFDRGKKMDLILCIIGVISALLSGTRGPLVCVVVCFVLTYINKITNKRKRFFFILFSILFLLLGGVDFVTQIVSELLTKFGFGDFRFVQYHEDNILLDSGGRDDIALKVWNATLDNGILGGGIGYDRIILDGSYSHNILVELCCEFGLLFGPAIILALIVIGFKYVSFPNQAFAFLGTLFVSILIIELLFSSSYLITFPFFLFLGLYFNNYNNIITQTD